MERLDGGAEPRLTSGGEAAPCNGRDPPHIRRRSRALQRPGPASHQAAKPRRATAEPRLTSGGEAAPCNDN